MGDLLQPTHMLFVLVVALLVLGPKRLPEVGRMLGRGLRDFRSAMSGEELSERTVPPATPQSTPSAPQYQPASQTPSSELATPPHGGALASPAPPEPAPQDTRDAAEALTPSEAVTTSMGTEPRA